MISLPVLDHRGPTWQLVALEAIERAHAAQGGPVGTAEERYPWR